MCVESTRGRHDDRRVLARGRVDNNNEKEARARLLFMHIIIHWSRLLVLPRLSFAGFLFVALEQSRCPRARRDGTEPGRLYRRASTSVLPELFCRCALSVRGGGVVAFGG